MNQLFLLNYTSIKKPLIQYASEVSMKKCLVFAVMGASTTVQADPKEWTLDLGHAYIGWQIDHMNLSSTLGQFREFDGTF